MATQKELQLTTRHQMPQPDKCDQGQSGMQLLGGAVCARRTLIRSFRHAASGVENARQDFSIALHPAFLPMSDERTFIAIKPDGVQRGLIGPILTRFEQRGFKLVGIKLTWANEKLLRQHYEDLQEKPFFPSLLLYMLSGPVLATVWEGKDVVKQGRAILGATNPLASAPGTIRGDYAIDMGRNVIHGSDSVETAQKEIGLWFKKEELAEYKPALHAWIYE